jgi:hypothetical protein
MDAGGEQACSKLGGSSGGLSADRGQGGFDEILEVSFALRIADTECGRVAIGLFRQFTPPKLGVEVAADQLEERIGRVLFRERPDDLQSFFVLLIVVVKVDGQVEASFGWSERAFRYGALQLANAFLLAAAGDAHEEAEDAGGRGESVGVIVVEAEPHVGVGEVRIESGCAQQTFARADTGACGVAVFSAQGIDARDERVAHSGVELHLGGVVLRYLGLGERGGFRGEFEIVLIGGELGAVARVGHAVFKFGGGAPDLPPEGFAFQEIAERMGGLLLLQVAGTLDGGGEIAGIDLIEDGGSGWGKVELCRAGWRDDRQGEEQ